MNPFKCNNTNNKKLERYVRSKFGINLNQFLEVLKMSPGAEGYIHGSLSEFLFRKYIENSGYEVFRIKEKPEGGYNAKNDEARGDFYIRKKGIKRDEWYVIENKGVKSNTEKHLFTLDTKPKLFNHLRGLAFPKKNYLDDVYIKGLKSYNKAKYNWESKNNGKRFPEFRWSKSYPGARSFNLVGCWKNEDELSKWVESLDEGKLTAESYLNLEGPVKMLSTHAPSNRVAPITGIKQAAPLVSEFNIMCVDLFQRIGEHKFVFMNPNTISHSPTSPEHLYQNYHIDYIIPGVKDKLKINHPWYENIEDCIKKTNPIPRKIDLSQIDKR